MALTFEISIEFVRDIKNNSQKNGGKRMTSSEEKVNTPQIGLMLDYRRQ